MKRIARLIVIAAVSLSFPMTAAAAERTSEAANLSSAGESAVGDVVFADFSRIDAAVQALEIDAVLEKIEFIAAPGSAEPGRTILSRDHGNKRLNSHWVPGDPRRGGFFDISYAVDLAEGATASGLSSAETEAAIDRAVGTWGGVRCSDLDLPKHDLDPTLDVGIIEHIYGLHGWPVVYADVTHTGWQPPEYFDVLTSGRGDSVLAATFTFVWIDRFRNPTDMDGDGRADVAFKEILYNDGFHWSNGASSNLPGSSDVESVALHEMGHGLSQAHFGNIFFDGSGKHSEGHFHVAPRAVMNAVSGGVQRDLLGTDRAGHCSIWADWPGR